MAYSDDVHLYIEHRQPNWICECLLLGSGTKENIVLLLLFTYLSYPVTNIFINEVIYAQSK